MLQQILKDMYIDPDVLEALSEDQKKTLFLKMRQEQVRRWKEREEKEDHRPKPSTANRKNVSWLLGRDGDVAVMVIGEVDELKTSKLICSGPVERKAPPSLHNSTRHQTTPPKSNLVNRPVSESVRTGRESLLPKTQPGIQLNLKENTEEVRTLPPLQVSVGEQQPPAALDKVKHHINTFQAELKQDLEVDAPEEKPVLSSCRPHSRAGTANPRLDTALSPVPKNFTITPSPVLSATPSPVPTSTPSPLPSTVTVSPVPGIVTPSPVPRSNAIRDALEKSAAKARASEKTITPSPVPSSVKTSPVPSVTPFPFPSSTPSPVPSVSPSPVPSSTPSPVPSIYSPSPFHRTIAPSPVASSTAIRDALEKSTTKPHGPEKTTVVPLSITTRLHPEEPAEPHPQETPSSGDIRVMAAYRRAMSEDVVSEGGGDTCSRSGRVAQLMKNFCVKSPTPPAQIPPPRGSKPPIPTKPNHLHLVASPSLR